MGGGRGSQAREHHIAVLRQAYRLRRDAIFHAVTTSFPLGTRCYQPRHGMFLWVELPRAIDMEMMLMIAIEQKKIAFVPGLAFSTVRNDAVDRSLRLNFSRCAPELITRGIAQLGELLSELP
jgi:2-aminoadipate transaminase